MSNLLKGLSLNPIVAAVNDMESLRDAADSDVEVIFVLRFNLLELKDGIEYAFERGKQVFVHLELVEGISRDSKGLEYILNTFPPTGIISTNSRQIKLAKTYGVETILRLFILDSSNLVSGLHTIEACKPDAVEILPGIIPEVISDVISKSKSPVIAGGLITKKKHVIDNLKVGVLGTSTSRKNLWDS